MAANFKDALKQRRTYYALSNKSLISDQEIEEIISHVLLYTPSPFNSQSTRIVLLLGENHKKLWQITKDALKKIVPAESFAATESKIDGAFASGYGSVLFFEDQSVVKGLQEAFPSYKMKKVGQPPNIKSDDHPLPISVLFYLFSFFAPDPVREAALLP